VDQRDRKTCPGWKAMKITADTDLLVRAITGDDRRQGYVARTQLASADRVALALPALCEPVRSRQKTRRRLLREDRNGDIGC
jgi:hypothetical protein